MTTESRKVLRKHKDFLVGNVADAIECNDWYFPVNTYEYIDLLDIIEKELHDFFDLPKDVNVHVEDFMTNILSYEKAISGHDLYKLLCSTQESFSIRSKSCAVFYCK